MQLASSSCRRARPGLDSVDLRGDEREDAPIHGDAVTGHPGRATGEHAGTIARARAGARAWPGVSLL